MEGQLESAVAAHGISSNQGVSPRGSQAEDLQEVGGQLLCKVGVISLAIRLVGIKAAAGGRHHHDQSIGRSQGLNRGEALPGAAIIAKPVQQIKNCPGVYGLILHPTRVGQDHIQGEVDSYVLRNVIEVNECHNQPGFMRFRCQPAPVWFRRNQ